MRPRIRNPEQTRSKLLGAAFSEFWEKGFGGASLDDVLATSGVTKGALYHHFSSKKALGLAVVREVIRETIVQHWVEPLEESDDPITTLLSVFAQHRDELTEEQILLGCPLNNTTQELAAVDEDFRSEVESAYTYWRTSLAEALQRGIENGTVRANVRPESVATFIVATCEGVASLAKAERSRQVLVEACDTMDLFLESLRP